MKNLFCVFALVCLSFSVFGQIPNLQIRDPQGTAFNLPDYMQNNKNYGLIIWSAQDPPSVAALEDYHQHYSGWNSTYNIEFLIISIDDSSQRTNVASFVNTKGWNYTLLFANATDAMEAFDIQVVPYIYLVDKQQKIKYEIAGAAQATALEQEIATHFTLGVEEKIIQDFVSVSTAKDKLVFQFTKSHLFIKISVYDMSGKLLLQESAGNSTNSKITLQTTSIQKGTIAIIRIEDGEKINLTKKVLII